MIIPGALMGVTDYVYVEGVAANPDSITAVLYRWVGSTRSASGITVSVAAVGSGEYRFTWTNDGGFARTDELELVALPVVSSVTYPATVWRSHGAVDAVMRGTDGANTTVPDNASAAAAAASAATAATQATNAATSAGSADGKLTTTVVTLWANLTAMITGSGVTAAFTEVALDNAPAGGGGGGGSGDAEQATSEEILAAVSATDAKVDSIALKTALINAGRLRVLSRVVGNVITAHAGDDHLLAADNALTLEIDDDDAALYALLTAADNQSVKFGAGRSSDTDADDISATIPAANIRHEGTSTFIDIELLSVDTVGRRGSYEFDIQITNAAGYKITPQPLQGTLMIEVDRKS